ncbi:hypothetical protein [Crocinitomix catalasitica]|uniref:hypothetical protein n=1 Tax=Crocinitomix catalasitica TaxID=184607 RepID=UPI000685930D|nr:hypothetical protein [Crocinitomix catalasitica]
MNATNNNWTKEELKTYILIYSANADLSASQEEITLIKSKVDAGVCEKMNKEFAKDNDYQALQKMLKFIENLGYSNEEIDALYAEINELFLTDNDFDIMEQNLGMGLKRLFGMIKADNEKQE